MTLSSQALTSIWLPQHYSTMPLMAKTFSLASAALHAFPRRCLSSAAASATAYGSALHTDVAIIGGGIIGLQAATELSKAGLSVRVLEKEAICGEHASGRNSGVLHAGVYYPADSHKAAFTVQGNAELRELAASADIPVLPCSKLILARCEADLPQLQVLHQRATSAGAPGVQLVDAAQVCELEPLAFALPDQGTAPVGLWCPSTAVSDPVAILQAVKAKAIDAGAVVHCGATVQHASATAQGAHIRLADGTDIHAAHVLNAAGQYADKIAHSMGAAADYTGMPFLGLYHYVKGLDLQRLLYPVPEPDKPFLGVHFTLTPHAKLAKIGPTAIPAFGREAYTRQGADPGETRELLSLMAKLAVKAGFDFRGHAWQEMKRYAPWVMASAADSLLDPAARPNWIFAGTGRPGIRAQLVHLPSRTLVQDFLVEPQPGATHILNAVSPGWTSSGPFARWVVQQHVLPALAGQTPAAHLGTSSAAPHA